MNTLLSAIFKFCTTNQLFKHIVYKYIENYLFLFVQYMLVYLALLHKTIHYYSVHFLSLPYSNVSQMVRRKG